MNSNLLLEPHNIWVGDVVVVKERQHPNNKFIGSVYGIVNKSMNEYIRDYKYIMVDHFYIKFSQNDNHLLLKKGLDVIYKHRPVVLGNVTRDDLGNITQIFIQKPFMSKTEINLDDINAMLCWHIAYDIQKA